MGQNRYIPRDIPLSTRSDPRFRAELLVYDELQGQLDLSQRDWVVAYQARWLLKESAQGEPKEGEADFLLAHPTHGVLAMEVKGGLISFQNGQWNSRDRTGVVHPIDPFAQVARNTRNLAKKFNELPNWRLSPISRFGRIVVFPDCATPAMATFPSDVSRENETLKFLFARPLEFTDSLGANVPLETRHFERRTDDQFRLVRAVSSLRRVACRGGAGAGKTWFARKKGLNARLLFWRNQTRCRVITLRARRSATRHFRDRVRI